MFTVCEISISFCHCLYCDDAYPDSAVEGGQDDTVQKQDAVQHITDLRFSESSCRREWERVRWTVRNMVKETEWIWHNMSDGILISKKLFIFILYKTALLGDGEVIISDGETGRSHFITTHNRIVGFRKHTLIKWKSMKLQMIFLVDKSFISVQTYLLVVFL